MSELDPGAGAVTLTVGAGRGTARSLPGPASACAVLVVDIQGSFADPDELVARGVSAEGRAAVAAAIDATERLVDAARTVGAKVVWVQLIQRPEAPWHSSSFLRERPEDAEGPCTSGTPGADWYQVGPGSGEPVVTKHRYSGFIGTDLDGVLRSLGVTWVIPCGLTTECCVESTARDAFQLDYPVVMAEEASASYDLGEHASSLELLAVNFALVTRLDDLLAGLGATPSAELLLPAARGS